MKRIKNKGFTLIEILVSLAILGIVLAGVYSVYNMQHKSYIVQGQVAEMQQSERVSLQMITKDIKMTGLGLQFNNANIAKITISNNNSGYDGSDEIGIEYHPFSPTEGGKTRLRTEIAAPIGPTDPLALEVNETAGFAADDWVIVINPPGCDTSYYALICITGIDSNSKTLQHDPGSSSPCASKENYDNDRANTFCSGSRVMRLNREGGGRITYSINDNYQLTRSVDNGAAEPVADNIEDMQVAYGIDIDNNGIIEDAEWFNNPAGLNMALLQEIRVTLVARTTNDDPAYNVGSRPAVEDHAPVTSLPDTRYRRRVLQSTINLRNIDEFVAMF